MGLFRSSRPLSPTRRALRLVVWTVFVIVAWMRWSMPRDPMARFGNGAFRGGRTLGGPGWRDRGPGPSLKPVAPIPGDLYRVRIELTPKDEETLGQYHWRWQGRNGGNESRPEVRITVREGDRVYTNVAMHLKGSAGSFQGLDGKPAMTLNFAKYAKGQNFHGYTKLSLNNSVQDPTYCSEAICREMFVEAGVPAPRVEHATVMLNDRELGLYVLSEGWGKPFLRRFFDDVGGNLYDGGFVQDIDADLGVNSGDDEKSRAGLDRLIEAARAPAARRWTKLNEVLDIDRFCTFAALEVMTCHWDGYCLNRNNYRVFEDRKTGKAVFMPHGLDQTFGTGRSHPHETIRPRMNGMIARSVLATPEGKARYMERLAALREKVFTEEKLTNRLWELANRLQPTL
ncbi:MAG: CotH kinase family protein, partial [Verrucomicrobiales bacterium]|nr:CotH kinase family protein [Verrucomicrobiales bacterium]